MTTRRRVARSVLVIAITIAVSCMFAACTKTVPRQTGTPQRIVSLSPSTTEALFALGGGGLLVGRSRYCDYPPEATRLPQVGGYVDPNLEAVLGLAPDLVVGARGPMGTKITDALDQRGIPWFFPKTESFQEIRTMIGDLGQRTGHDHDAKRILADLDASLAHTRSRVAGRTKPRTLLVFGFEPIVVAGPAGFANEILTAAGGENVVREGEAYPTLGMERVLALDPDVILNAVMSEANAAARISKDAPGWSKLRAVQAGRVVVISDESVLRPGPRVGRGVNVVAHALFPDLSQDSPK